MSKPDWVVAYALAETEERQYAPYGLQNIRGRVLAVRSALYGNAELTVRALEGYRVAGIVDYETHPVMPGEYVEFVADILPTIDDEYLGHFSQPIDMKVW